VNMVVQQFTRKNRIDLACLSRCKNTCEELVIRFVFRKFAPGFIEPLLIRLVKREDKEDFNASARK
jgi:hypothetical protein